MIIETERLILRPIEKSDAEDVYEYSKNEKVGPNAGWEPHPDKRHSAAVIKEIFLNRPGVFGIVPKDSGKLIGSAGLAEDKKRPLDEVRMLGYALGEEYWGNGYATEAAHAVIKFGFEKMDIELISAYCYPFNLASKNVLEKCGMKYEGILRFSEKIYDGKIYDLLCFSLRRTEYYNQTLFGGPVR